MSAASSMKEGQAPKMNDDYLRIVMVGRTGAGKSAAENTILGEFFFESKRSLKSLTTTCKKAIGLVDGRKVSVVDTPGFFDTRFSIDKTIQEIKRCICFAAPGPHVFLIVIKPDRFTEEEQKTVEIIQEAFGQMSNKYTMILFTNGDQLEDEPIEEMMKDSPKLSDLYSKCNGRYHVFNNKTGDASQVTELLEKINDMVLKNGGSHYTTEMFQEAEKAIEEEKQIILVNNKAIRSKEEEKLREEFKGGDLEKRLQSMKERHEQEAREKAEKNNKFLAFRLLGAAGGFAAGAIVGLQLDFCSVHMVQQ